MLNKIFRLAQIAMKTLQIFDLFFLLIWIAPSEADRIKLEKKG